MIEDLDERAAFWAGALCAAPRRDTQRAWVKELDLPFRTDPASVQRMKALCLRCLLTAECAAEGVDAEFGVWAGQLHEPAQIVEEAG